MFLQVLVVRDRTADVFGRPFFDTSIGGAVRNFVDEINRIDPNNALNRHPEDFDLYHLGTYEDSNGRFDLLSDPRQVAIGKDCVKK